MVSDSKAAFEKPLTAREMARLLCHSEEALKLPRNPDLMELEEYVKKLEAWYRRNDPSAKVTIEKHGNEYRLQGVGRCGSWYHAVTGIEDGF